MFFAGFVVNAYISGAVIACLAAMVGFFTLLRGSAFAAHALPKVGFAGAAGAILIRADPIIGLAVFATGGALAMGWLGRRGRRDVAVALTLVVALGTGALFLVLQNGYASDAYSLLFGQTVGISSRQVFDTLVLGVAGIVSLLILYRPLLFASITPEGAQARGLPVDRVDTAFLVITGLATAVTVPVVGILLTFSLIVAPAAAAGHLTHRPLRSLATSAGIAVVTVWAALTMAFVTGLPIGFFVATISTLVYAGARLVEFLLRTRTDGGRQGVR